MAAWARENAEWLEEAGLIDMVTVTAPGEDWLPWDRSRCRIKGPHKCSGPLGCKVEAWAAEDWNAHHFRRLSRWLDAAHRAVERRGFRKGRGRPPWIGVPEMQPRGVLHWHFLFSAEDRPYVIALCHELRRLAGKHGFGRQVDFTPCLEAGRSKGMAYVVKAAQYVAKGATEAETRGEIVSMLKGPFVGQPFMRASPKLTAVSRVTMRNLRDRRTLYARGKVYAPAGYSPSCRSVERAMIICRELEEQRRGERAFMARLESVFGDKPPPPRFRRAMVDVIDCPRLFDAD